MARCYASPPPPRCLQLFLFEDCLAVPCWVCRCMHVLPPPHPCLSYGLRHLSLDNCWTICGSASGAVFMTMHCESSRSDSGGRTPSSFYG